MSTRLAQSGYFEYHHLNTAQAVTSVNSGLSFPEITGLRFPR